MVEGRVQVQPREEAAGGTRPAHPLGHEPLEGGHHGGAARAVQVHRSVQGGPPVLAGHVLGGELLAEHGRVDGHGLGRDLQPGPHRRRRRDPADPQPGREDLGEAAQVDHGARVQRVQGREPVGAVEAEQRVRVVLEDEHPAVGADLHEPPAPLLGEGHPGGVVEVRDGVDELHAPAGGPQPVDPPGDRLGVQSVVVDVHVGDLDLVAAEHAEGPHVGGALGHDHVPRVAEQLGHEVETRLGPGGDLDRVGRGLRALQAHELHDQPRQAPDPGPGAVLEHLGAALGEDPRRHRGHHVVREHAHVRIAAGQGDDPGAHRDLEHGPDRGGPELLGAVGEQRGVVGPGGHGRAPGHRSSPAGACAGTASP